MTTEYKRRKERSTTEAARLSAAPAERELGLLTDTKQLIVGGESKAGGYLLTPDYVIAPQYADQTDATKHLSLAWWIARLNGEEATLRLTKGTYNILNDITVPANVCLKFDKGASLKVSDTKTLTINGAIEAGLWQIFGGEGTTTGAIQSHYIYPEWFGAVGDGITDDTLAIQAAVAIPAVVWCSAKYRITDTIALVGSGCTGMVWEGACANNHFLYDGNGVAMSIQGFNHVSGFTFRVRKQTMEWGSNEATADRTSTGILFVGGGSGTGYGYLNTHATTHSTFFIESVMNFALGVRFAGVATWNKITLGYLLQNWVALYWDEYADYVWSNENYFYGGEIKCFRPSTWPTLITGNRMMHINGSGNCFFGLCLEDNQSMEYIITGDGSSNNFFGTRMEGILPGSIDLRNTAYTAYPNLWVGGYELSKGKFTDGALYSNSVIGGSSWIFGGQSADGIYMTNAQSSLVNKSIFKTGLNVYGTENTFVPGKGLTMDIHAAKIEMYKGTDGYENPSLVLEGGPSYFGRILFGTGLSGHIAGETPGIQAGSYNNLMISGSAMVPYTDDYMNIGSGSNRFDNIYATNGSIQTSDERAKTEISSIPDEWLDAWAEVDYTRFKMVDAVQKKGSDNARWHIGLIAQRVKEAFEARGLDAMKIGLLCYDEWDDIYEEVEVIDSEAVMDEEGNIITPEVKHTETVHSQTAGSLYSIRYNEALAMEAAYMRREVERLKSSINA